VWKGREDHNMSDLCGEEHHIKDLGGREEKNLILGICVGEKRRT
jgi:hypothetical protein